jgi:ribosomal-protein-alanine N-acetyltransferase
MNIKLVPACLSFTEVFHKWRGETNTVKFNPVVTLSLEEAREVLAKAPKTLQPLQEASTHRWFVDYHGKPVGVVSLTEVSVSMGTGQIGYTIGADHQGRGIATAALRLWTQLLLEKTNLRKLTALVNEHNGASLRVLEKCGYKREGFLREHFMIQGKASNQVVFGILRSEIGSSQELLRAETQR